MGGFGPYEMAMPELHIMIGVPGSGKSTFARGHYADGDAIVSSDAVRKELYGDEGVQGDPNRVFSICMGRIRDSLRKGASVWFDATNITAASRRQAIAAAQASSDRGIGMISITAEITAPPLSLCFLRNSQRERSVPDGVIWKMARSFQMPVPEEGFTGINIHTARGLPDIRVALPMIMEEMGAFSHGRGETLLDHGRKAEALYMEKRKRDAPAERRGAGMPPGPMGYFALLHDYGKMFTKSTDGNGEARYHGHEGLGAYLLLSEFGWPVTHGVLINGLFLVSRHTAGRAWEQGQPSRKFERLYGRERAQEIRDFAAIERMASGCR